MLPSTLLFLDPTLLKGLSCIGVIPSRSLVAMVTQMPFSLALSWSPVLVDEPARWPHPSRAVLA